MTKSQLWIENCFISESRSEIGSDLLSHSIYIGLFMNQIQTDAHSTLTNNAIKFILANFLTIFYNLWTFDQIQLYTFITNDERGKTCKTKKNNNQKIITRHSSSFGRH